jgi:hypothetical protein
MWLEYERVSSANLAAALLRLVPSAIACVSLADSPVPARCPQPLRSRSRRTS